MGSVVGVKVGVIGVEIGVIGVEIGDIGDIGELVLSVVVGIVDGSSGRGIGGTMKVRVCFNCRAGDSCGKVGVCCRKARRVVGCCGSNLLNGDGRGGRWSNKSVNKVRYDNKEMRLKID